MNISIIKCLLVLVLLGACAGNSTDYSETEIHEREKRFIAFRPLGGLAKILLGFLVPVQFKDFKLVRNVANLMNLQANYNIPQNVIWPVPQNIFKNRLNNDFVDNSRRDLYKLVEKMFDSYGAYGRACVLKAICEVAEAPLGHNGMFGEILDVLLTPYKTDSIDEIYKEARINGLNGKKCGEIYHKCTHGSGLLEKMSLLDIV